ncbi:hypothetical protein cypCar_00011006 [Cyprinus carpio]|nr:hypothetical protein cypCar_00011006 [Cyprinus carpio]
MKAVAFLMCLLGSSIAAPAPDSDSNEQAIISHANTALQLMELYRMFGHLRQQGFGAVPIGAQLPAQPQVSPQAPQQGIFFNPTGDESDEEGAVEVVEDEDEDEEEEKEKKEETEEPEKEEGTEKEKLEEDKEKTEEKEEEKMEKATKEEKQDGET